MSVDHLRSLEIRMVRFFWIFLALSALWLLNSGYFDHPLLLGLGLISVLVSIWLAARAGMLDNEGVPGGIFPRIFGYWWWLFAEIGKSNITVARHVLSLEPTLSPKLFRVPLAPRTNVGRATFANSITLTPGTVSVYLDHNSILVHALTEELADVPAIADMGERVLKTEGESGQPVTAGEER